MKLQYFILAIFFISSVSALSVVHTNTDATFTSYTGNITNLSEMEDVSIPAPTDGQVLTYHDASGLWIASSLGTTISWAAAVNGTLFSTALWETNYTANNDNWNNRTNLSYYLATNPFAFYNITTAPIYINDTFSGNYSNFTTVYNYALNSTGVTWAEIVNGTMFSQSDWDTNYTANNDLWLNTTNLTYAALNSSGLIRDWNSTGFIINWNATGDIADWNSTGYIKNWTIDIFSSNTSIYNWIVAQGYTAGGISWANAINGTLFTQEEWDTNYTANDAAWRNMTNLSYVPYNGSTQNTDLGIYNLTTKGTGFFANLVTSLNGSFGVDLYIGQNLFVAADSIFGGDLFPTTTLNSDLGSGAKRWQWLYVQNISSDYINNAYDIDTANLNASGNITATGYFLGNGSQLTDIDFTELDPFWNSNWTNFSITHAYALNGSDLWSANYSTFLTHIDWSEAINGTLLSQADWDTNYTANNNAWLNTTNLTYDGYNNTGLIRDWNSTGYISNWNSTGLIANWSLVSLIETDPFWTANQTLYNSTWNNRTNSSYYLVTNPFSFYNVTTAPIYINDTFSANYSTFLTHISWANAINGTLMQQSTFDTNYTANDAAYRLDTDTFQGNYSNFTIVYTYALNDTDYNSSGLIRDWNSTGFIADWNSTGFIANWSIDTSGFLTEETDPYWTANYSLFNSTWSNTTNTSYVKVYGDELNGTFNLNDGILRIQDDASLVVYDTDGEAHLVDADLEKLDQIRANTFTGQLTSFTLHNATGDYINISTDNGKNIVAIIGNKTNAISESFGYSSVILELTPGTNDTPIKNNVYAYLSGEDITWGVSATTPTFQHAMVARVLLGEDGTTYAASLQEDGDNGFFKRVQRRFRKEGLLYGTGFDYNGTSSEITIGTGTYINGVYDLTSEGTINSSVGFYLVKSDGTYQWYNSFSDFTEYADGNTIGSNKYFNVIFGIIPYDGSGNIYAVVQDKPSTEYTSMVTAWADGGSTLNIAPSEDFLKLLFLPIGRMIINENGDAQLLPNGEYVYDYRGGIAGGASSGGGLTEVDPVWAAEKSSYSLTTDITTAIGAANTTLLNWIIAQSYTTWENIVNGTMFSQSDWDTNYTANDAAWRLDTDTFQANYSDFLTHITWANAINGTLFSQADWDINYTANDAIWRNNTGILWSEAINGTLYTQLEFDTNYTANDAAYRTTENPFDQVLNTTSNVDFNNATIEDCIIFSSGGMICDGI